MTIFIIFYLLVGFVSSSCYYNTLMQFWWEEFEEKVTDYDFTTYIVAATLWVGGPLGIWWVYLIYPESFRWFTNDAN